MIVKDLPVKTTEKRPRGLLRRFLRRVTGAAWVDDTGRLAYDCYLLDVAKKRLAAGDEAGAQRMLDAMKG